MQFEGGSRVGILISAVVLVCIIFTATSDASEIYNNPTVQGLYAPGDGFESIDYGTTSQGGKVTQFTFGYAADHYGTRSATVRFYQGTDYYSTGRNNLLATFVISLQVASTSFWYPKTYSIPTNDQFNLQSGEFGYSFEFNDDVFYAALAKDGSGNEDYLWELVYDDYTWSWDWEKIQLKWWGGPYSGFYMQIEADPLAEPTRVSGYKFDDADGDGVWDGDEDGLPGWRIYIDENDNGQFDSTEPNDITDPNGYYEFLGLPTPDTITVAEEMQGGWTQTLPGGAGTYEVSIEANEQYENNFGNTDEPVVTDVTISGWVNISLYYHINLPGVLIEATGTTSEEALTNQDGYYEIVVPSGWSGTVSASKPGWVLIFPVTFTNLSENQSHNFYAYWPYSGGIGSEASPYQISTVQDLFDLGDNTHDYDKHFVLTNDIDLTGTTHSNAIIAPYEGSPPFNGKFKGEFDGAGFSVLNLQGNSGLFGYIMNAVIKNLGVENVEITSAGIVGPLCHSNHGGTIENCFSTGNISGFYDIGGLCAWVHKEYIEEYFPVESLPAINTPVIKNCYSTVNVTLNHPNILPEVSMGTAGGLCAYAEGAELLNNYACGSVDATGIDTPFDFDIIIDNGGLVGHIKDCDVNNNYSSGYVVDGRAYSNPGGFCGLVSGDPSTFAGNFWDTQASDQSTSACGTGMLMADMKTKQTFINGGWDFVGETANGNEDIWRICDGFDYPHLSWEEMIAGDIACPDGVGIEDFAAVAGQWGLSRLDGDVWPNGGDGIINLADFARMASAWLSVSPEDAFDQACDIAPPEGDNVINTEDIAALADQWLQKSAHSAELATGVGDRFVGMLDWSVFASAWQSGTGEPNFEQRCDLAAPEGYIDVNDLVVFASQWLMTGKTLSDIAPNNINTVGYEDLEVIAENWLTGR